MDHRYDDTEVTISSGDSSVTTTTGEMRREAERLGQGRMKETPADQEVRDKVEDATAARLRSFIERLERLEEEKREIAADVKEVFAEAKGEGFDTTAMRKIIKLRKQDPDDRAEEQAVLELYMAALGMQ